MAEIYLAPDDDQQAVVRELLDKTDDPGSVAWSPRPDVPHGGVYVVSDGLAEEFRQARADRLERESAAIQARIDAANERDEAISGTDLTPAEAGFAASTDAGAEILAPADDEPDEGDREAAEESDTADVPAGDVPADETDEERLARERAERRAARRAERQAAAAPTEEGK